VADVIIASLLVEGTPVPRKVSRLHLICDILHNSAVSLPGAWRFRGEFQARLGLAFDHLAGIYHSFPGRITAETFKRQITAVLDVWEDWIVFPPEFTAMLRERLEGQAHPVAELETEEATPLEADKIAAIQPQASRFKAIGSGFQPATQPVPSALGLQEPVDLDGEPLVDDLDGEPVDMIVNVSEDNDLDGEPMTDVDGEPVDVDGEPLDLDGEPVDGEPVGVSAADDDLDGEPMDMDDLDGVTVDV
jgi:U2-associated protein SR140